MKNFKINIRFIVFYCLFALMVFSLFIYFRAEVIQKLDNLFSTETKEDLNEFGRILHLKQSRLESYAFDYSYWDDFVKYINHPTDEWVNENIVSTMKSFDAFAVVITNKNNKVIFDKTLKPNFDFHACLENSFVMDGPTVTSNWFRHFYIKQHNQIWEVRQAPIQYSNDEQRDGLPAGYFYVADIMDSTFQKTLSGLTGNEVKLNFDVSNTDSVLINKSGGFVVRYFLKNPNQIPVASLDMIIKSSAVATFKNAFYSFFILLVIIFMAVSGIAYYLIWLWLVRPVGLISNTLESRDLLQLNGIRKHDQEFNNLKRLIEKFFKQEKDLLEAKNKAEIADKAKSNFLAIVSHEMRTPLHSIIGNADLLTHSNLHGLQAQFNESIKVNSDLLLQVINDILDYAKLESGKFEITKSEFNLSKLIDQLVEIFRLECVNKNITLIYFFDETLPVKIITDPLRLRQVLVNLINNAIKFTERGGIDISIVRTLSEKGEDQISFSVKDSGIGIKESEIQKIFSPFEQSENFISRQKSGTGLGLSISKRLVELMGGEIQCKSKLNEGSTFTFTIQPKFTNEILARKINLPAQQKRPIVIIHPNKNVQNNLAKLVRLWGLEYLTFDNIETACDIKPDASICIINESEIPSLIQKDLLEDWKNRKLPFIILTSKNVTDFETAVQSFGINYSVVNTPFKHYDIFHALQILIENVSPVQKEKFIQVANLLGTRVLVAEDNEVNQQLIKHYLLQFNIDPVFALNGKEALEKILTGNFQMVFMDISMPVMDGLETTKKIRESNLQFQPFIVGISAHAYSEEMDKAMQSGMNEYLVKPITFDLFTQKMTEWKTKMFFEK